MIVWIERPLALAIHHRQLAEHGGGSGVRDMALLDSALARPKQLQSCGNPPPDFAALAASVAYGLAHNHPFVDGNKRTAAVCCETFILLNGGELLADDLALYPAYLGLSEGSLSEEDFADWLRKHVVTSPANRVNEPRSPYVVR